MKDLSPEDAIELMKGIVSLIKGELPQILAHRYEIEWKPDGSPVTKSDVYLEEIIHQFIKDQISDVAFIGEESFSPELLNSPHTYYAILDPIDGTENFCSGLKEWGVSFTFWKKDQHLGSFLYMPELDECLMTGDTLQPIRSRIRGFSSSMCDEILEAIAETRESRLMGCAVYNLYNVIRGSFVQFTNPRGAYVWDLLPGLMLALEHNCEVHVDGEKYNGQFLNPNKKYRIDIQHRYDFHSR